VRFWVSHPFGRSRLGVSFGGGSGGSRQRRRGRRRSGRRTVIRTVVVEPQRGSVVVRKDRLGWPSVVVIVFAIGFVGAYPFVAVPVVALTAVVVTCWSRRLR
jgi:hypothetical protein